MFDDVDVPAFFLAHNASCRSWSSLSRARRMRAALMYLHPGVFIGDGGATPWTRVPMEMYLHGEAFMRRVDDFCGTLELQYPEVYLARWPVYGWYGGWGVPRWRWHGGPHGPIHHGPMPHFPAPGPHPPGPHPPGPHPPGPHPPGPHPPGPHGPPGGGSHLTRGGR